MAHYITSGLRRSKLVLLKAPAHLHLGNLDLTKRGLRLFGTLGFAVEEPRLRLKAEEADRIEAEEAAVRQLLEKILRGRGGIRIEVEEAMPKSVGLGYEITTILAAGVVASELYELDIGPEGVWKMLGETRLTALGLYAFERGGFIADGGLNPKKKEKVPPLIFRCELPRDWWFLICIPLAAVPKSLELKSREKEILRTLQPMSEELACKLSRLTLLGIFPSVLEEDLETFGRAITELNRELGKYWAAHQGGIYCHNLVEEGIELLLEEGFASACQSCWGPTFYGITNSKALAKRVASSLRKRFEAVGGCAIWITRADNRGYELG